MPEAAVVQLGDVRRKQRKSVKSVARPRGRRAVRALRRQAYIAAGIGAVTLLIIGLSLSHSVHGVQIITGCAAWESWAMATSIEIGFVLTKLAMLIANERVRRQIGWLANCTIVGTLAGMAAMNVYAFTAYASGPLMTAAGVALGLAIPRLCARNLRSAPCGATSRDYSSNCAQSIPPRFLRRPNGRLLPVDRQGRLRARKEHR